MRYVRKAAPHVCTVLKGMLFIGFSIQIVFGMCWIGCNFGHVQSFGEPDSACFRGLSALFGGNVFLLQSLQLGIALLTGTVFLQKLQPAGIPFALWRGMALLTFPFALQCHLALQPYSLMGSLFLLMLLALLRIDRRKALLCLATAAACGGLMAALSGVADADRLQSPGYSLEGAMASRFAWPTMWNDFGLYGEEVAEAAGEVAWEASLYPGSMKLFMEALEERLGREAAEAHYLEMAEVGWDRHKSMVIRQIGWDALGYVATPVIFRLQMAGEGYDSYSGRNYEIMREKAPILTKRYVDYGCWWFVCAIGTALALVMVQAFGRGFGRKEGSSRRFLKKLLVSIAVCAGVSGLLAAALTMRGAGLMDYRCTIGVNELWLVGALLPMGKECRFER